MSGMVATRLHTLERGRAAFMNTAALPDRVFMTGTRESHTKVSLNCRKLEDGQLFLCIWTSEDQLKRWMTHQGKNYSYFDIETRVAFAALFSNPATRYVLVDPQDSILGKPLNLDSFSSENSIDLHSVRDVWSVLCGL